MTPEALAVHFMVPVNAATAFFTYVVPLMLLTGAILIYSEWTTKQRTICILSYAALLLMMVVGYFLIAPVNESIAGANLDPLELEEQLKSWMLFNDIRCVIMTAMWLIIVYYFISKGNLLEKFSTESTNEP